MRKYFQVRLGFTLILLLNLMLISAPACADPQIYVSDSAATHISRYQPDGSQREELLRGFAPPNFITVDETNQKIYWTASSRIVSCNFDSSGLEVLYDSFDGVNQPVGIAVDPTNKWIYVADKENRRLMKYDFSGRLLADLGVR